MSTKTVISVEEFDRLVEPDELRYELDEGELITLTRPGVVHGRIERRLIVSLQMYLDTRPIGEVFGSNVLFVLGPSTKRAPDVSVVLRSIDPAKEIQGAPELAIEILSRSNSSRTMRRKISPYFAAGCRLVWLVNPETRTVEVWMNPESSARVLHESDTLEASAILPGFAIPVARLF